MLSTESFFCEQQPNSPPDAAMRTYLRRDSECEKWLKGRVRTMPLAETSRQEVISSVRMFLSPRCPAQVLILSYETFRIHSALLTKPGACDLLICDEAHRLKNDETLTNRALDALECKRRILLSGTPIQNKLVRERALLPHTSLHPYHFAAPSL